MRNRTTALGLAVLALACSAATLPAADDHQATTQATTHATTQPAAKPALVVTVDVSKAPGMEDYAEKVQALADEWYPKLVEMLPSEGFEPTKQVTIYFEDDMEGVAYASGNEIHCAGKWFRERPEDIGAIVHELVHTTQQYRRRNPGWLVEGIADQIRWFVYEPESARPKPNPQRANYNDSYRTTGHFLNWTQEKYNDELVVKLNAACRQGKYSPAIWEELTGKSLEDLGAEWKQSLSQ